MSNIIGRRFPESPPGSVESLLRTVGVEVKNRYARCPLHPDRHPSFRIFTRDDGIERFNCFGCGARGTAVRLANLLRALNPEALPSEPETPRP